ncbi:NAD-dependent epimerase/dehydratase family protein [Billgrantia kenyensis]|uniref:NAD-dependent epimerase/dehydratase family protein n=1 Tax=Billgrantia kenyensis TaxID=321266 RepID=A0A7V9W000_9GAMM|nr:vitamin K epoxide reductase family protein [Halomonas kenyensis]MBA2778522.1 NAD-dependent epimerase/dehydratase family protein [Halomonas kenyensis]MCG6661673.1 NAD-dependent epimerase/dehydratase family protein [Halomonas kenyensis]
MHDKEAAHADKPLVIITGASGGVGTALTQSLNDDYRIIALDRNEAEQADESHEFDLTDVASIKRAMDKIAERHGCKIAAVVHLAAYFDFTGEESPLYEKVNEQGTRNLLEALEGMEVERFIYSSTMLVHEPQVPGRRVSEETPIGPTWAYPQSKARTEAVIREHATMPFTLLRLAGMYDEKTSVPTLSHQIARIYEHTLKSHVYSGNTNAGQACVHKEDMIDAFRRTIDRRRELPERNEILIGEEHAVSYEALQNRLGELIHGKKQWKTLVMPKPLAKTGALLEEKSEPLVPDDFDKGEKPFIRPFMIDMADDHYELDIRRAREQLGWEPRHEVFDALEAMVDHLLDDPHDWYQANGITPPDWIDEAEEKGLNPERVLEDYQAHTQREHYRFLWAHFFNIGLGAWLVASPATLGYGGAMAYSDMASGLLLALFGALSLSLKLIWARWVCAVIGLWVLFAPLVFWSDSAAAYLNGTLVGTLAIGFAAVVRPSPGVSPAAAMTGPTTPPGWNNNPSSWFQRMPIIALAFVGFFISRYLAAYQLGHIDAVWDPFFDGTREGLNGTEDIVTSEASEAWPVPDAGLGGMVYMLEIMLGMMGAANRWRTMPWVVASFGVLIVPLGVVSVTFIIIQPILIGTWCTLCLIQAGAMLLQIAYAFNEFVATGEFLKRRHKSGAPVLKIFFTGDTDDGSNEEPDEDFQRKPTAIIGEALGTGVNLPWNLALCILIGAWLMLTRITFGAEGILANWNHLVGALLITLGVIAMAESARPARWLMIPLATILLFTPFLHGADTAATINSLLCAVAVIALCLRRGPIRGEYGRWSRLLA